MPHEVDISSMDPERFRSVLPPARFDGRRLLFFPADLPEHAAVIAAAGGPVPAVLNLQSGDSPFWDGLSAEEQKMLRDSFAETREYQRDQRQPQRETCRPGAASSLST